MAGAHSRSSRHERPDDAVDRRPTPRDLDGSDTDRDYGEIFRPRPADDPAPPSPPVGFPTALSSSSFRAPGAGRHAEPEPAAVGVGASSGSAWSGSALSGSAWSGSDRFGGPTSTGTSSAGTGGRGPGRSATLAPPPAVPPPPAGGRPGPGDDAPRTGGARPGAAPVAPRPPHTLSGPQALAAPPA
ncbi:hypothetical protein HH311_29795, partial [Actinomycetospora sp. TBRC 11914]|nr:hypothetical protein [Actinomycetospora sp. TBRC 11914]